MNEVINKRCFIKKGEYTYCSKCGKEILNTSLEFHAKQCGFKSRDFVREFNEEDYAYAFRILEGSKRSVLKFYVFKPVLVKDNIDSISRGEWEEVYNCSLLRDSKKIIEDKPYKKGYEYYLSKCIACLNHTEYEAVRRFFSIPEIESLEMLFYLYKTQSFHVNEIITEEEAEDIIMNNSRVKIPRYSSRIRAKKDSDTIFAHARVVNTSVNKPLFLIKVAFNKEHDYVNMLVGKDYLYCREDIKLAKLFRCNLYLDILDADIEVFDNAYPEYKLKAYMNKADNLFVALFGAKFSAPLELLLKSDCILLADKFYSAKLNLQPVVNPEGTNLRDILGLPVKILKKLDPTCFYDTNLFVNLALVYQYNANYLNVEKITSVYYRFLFNNVIRGDIRGMFYTRIHSWASLSNSIKFRIARNVLTYEGRYLNTAYRDYLNMSLELYGCYVDGVSPSDLIASHDKVMIAYREYKSEAENQKFVDIVTSDNYRRLTTEDDDYYKDSEFRIIAPENPMDLLKEGHELHHCVGSYVRQILSGDSRIYFLRRSKEADKPYGTIEVNSDEVVQVKGFFNGRLDENAQNFVREWAEANNLVIKTHDMQQLIV